MESRDVIQTWRPYSRPSGVCPQLENDHKAIISSRDLAAAVTQYTELTKAGQVIKVVLSETESSADVEHGKPYVIRIRIARNWVRRLRLEFEQVKKGVYQDEHERPDVVNYRQKSFVPQYLNLLKLAIQVDDEGHPNLLMVGDTQNPHQIVAKSKIHLLPHICVFFVFDLINR